MIKNSSASALTWLSAILLCLGLLMMSPSGSFVVFIMATLFASAPALFGSKNVRIVAIILLLAAIILAASQYPEFQKERNRFSKRDQISRKKPLRPSDYCLRTECTIIVPQKSCNVIPALFPITGRKLQEQKQRLMIEENV